MHTLVDVWTLRWRTRPALRALALFLVVAAVVAVSALGWTWSARGTAALALDHRLALLGLLGAAGAAWIAWLRPQADLTADGRLRVRGSLHSEVVHLDQVVSTRRTPFAVHLTLTDGRTVRVAALAQQRSLDQAAAHSPHLAQALGRHPRPRLTVVPALGATGAHDAVTAEIARMQARAAHTDALAGLARTA